MFCVSFDRRRVIRVEGGGAMLVRGLKGGKSGRGDPRQLLGYD